MSKKHLVLDEDVYAALVRRKRFLGTRIGAMGNSILRNHIADTHLKDLICRQLISSGRISEDDYNQALQEATAQIRRSWRRTSTVIPVTHVSSGRMIAGSWEIEDITHPEDRTFQLLECWARDSRHQPMAEHSHEAEEYFVMLSGRALFIMQGQPITITKGNILQIPSNIPHTATPLDEDCHLLALTVPATVEYAAVDERVKLPPDTAGT